MNKNKILFFLLSNFFINNSLAINDDKDNTHFTPNIYFSGTGNKSRSIFEIDLMLPLIQSSNNLILSDIKLKNDDKKSYEYNLGLGYRHNFSDQIILGFYNYFDRRVTNNNLHVNQWTAGIELLSNYVDGRFNLYKPHNKKKIIKPASIKFVRDKTRIYGLKKGAVEERALPGYDIEIGFPVFGIVPHLNNKLGTKFYVARYYFHKKGIAKNIGTRLRFEQPIFNDYFNQRNAEVILFGGSSKSNREKWHNFAGISLKMAIGKNSSNFIKKGFRKRMMDNIVRDVDIVTSSYQVNTTFVPVFWDKQLVQNIYFVGDTDNTDYLGDGTYNKPFTKKQFKKLKKSKELIIGDTDIVIPIKLDKELKVDEYNELVKECSILNHQQKQLIHLQAESTLFHIEQYFPDLKRKKLSDNFDNMMHIYKNYEQNIILENDIRDVVEFISENNNYNHQFASTDIQMLSSAIEIVVNDNEEFKPLQINNIDIPLPDFNNMVIETLTTIDKNNLSPASKTPRKKPLTPRALRFVNTFNNIKDTAQAVNLIKEIKQLPLNEIFKNKNKDLTPRASRLFNAALNITDFTGVPKFVKEIKNAPLDEFIKPNNNLTPRALRFYNSFRESLQQIKAPVFD